MNDTIAAVATSTGPGGVGIVRISGPETLRVLRAVFSPLPENVTPRLMYLGQIRAPGAERETDQGFAVWMPAPRSYTGEDAAELQCHGGPLNLRHVLQAVLAGGARAAEPGEFTRRAFLNEKLDLAQAEAVLDIVHARSAEGLDTAHQHLAGQLSQAVEALRQQIVETLAHLEVNIDFVEEDVPMYRREELAHAMDKTLEELQELARTFERGRLLRDGFSVAIAGPPNAGKSSLFNALLRESRSIVTDIAGTTRDYIEEQADLDGLPVVLVDTAGLRSTEDTIEQEGVSRSQDRMKRADIVLLVHDGSAQPRMDDLARCGAAHILVINKCDLDRHPEWSKNTVPAVSVSALTGEGLEELVEMLHARTGALDSANGVVVTRARHRTALDRAATAMIEAGNAMRKQLPYEIVAGELQLALEAVGEIVGITTTDDVLDHIFGEFCIGK